VPNRFHTNLKQQILDAAAKCKHSKSGDLDGYLTYCAETFPQEYLRVIGKMLPWDIRMKAVAQIDSAADIRQQLRERGVPIDKIYPLPQVMLAPLKRREPPGRAPHRETPRDEAVVSEPQSNADEQRRYDNMFSATGRRVEPYVSGPLPINGEIGSQFELNFGSRVPLENHCWHEGRPPRLVVSNDEDQTDGRAKTAKAK
jgi:hypothetical protein